MLEIQRLKLHEGERLREIRLASLKDAPDAFGTTFLEAATWPQESWSKQIQALPTFVAVLDGLDGGIVLGAPHTHKADMAYLISMWVAPNARGVGVGEALIDAVIDWGRTEGFACLLLDVGDNNKLARALYERKGFKPTGERSTMPPPREYIHEHRMSIDL